MQFYIVLLDLIFILCAYFYNPTAQNTWYFPKITTIWSQDIYFVVDMDYVDESDAVMFNVKLTSNVPDRKLV